MALHVSEKLYYIKKEQKKSTIMVGNFNFKFPEFNNYQTKIKK